MKKQVKILLNIVLFFSILTVGSAIWGVLTSSSSGGDTPQGIDPYAKAVAPPTVSKQPSAVSNVIEGLIDGHLEYSFDILAIDEYFLIVRAHPGDGIPGVKGGFVTTDVEVVVQLRGVSVPSACRTPESRSRPHEQVERERKRWADGMSFVTSLLMMNQSVRLKNVAVIDEKIVADISYHLGNEWYDLADTLISDGFAKEDTYIYNWGAEQLHPE